MDFIAPHQYQQEWYAPEHLDVKPQMTRSTSTNSVYQHEFAPGLSASNGSIRSGSSSTVGSPYSGPAIKYPQDESYLYNALTEGGSFDMMPAIVGQEAYSQDFMSDFSSDLPMNFDKMTGSFVGECADLSSSHIRSSTLRLPISQPPSISPVALFNDPLLANSFTSPPTSNHAQTPRSSHSSPQRSSISPRTAQDPIFKSPSTPASAYPKTPGTTSPQRRQKSPHVRHPAPQMQSTSGPFQNHFFAQSSGNFMPPIESSCRFTPILQTPYHIESSTLRTSMLTTFYADPSLIGGYPEQQQAMFVNAAFNQVSPMASPVPSPQFYNQQFAQPMPHDNYMQQQFHMMRQPSHGSHYSPAHSHASPVSEFENAEDRRCPYTDCGKPFKDLKAHMLTHLAERPEKCPITTCEYHRKGFSRKYDKNRHTLTHYKGTMVCGFCPGSGTPSEKSFNRADVFKRHLTSLHGVEQTPPNSRKRSPTASTKKLSSYCADATGKCSTCNATFNNAQDFYEHLDECVMRVVQQEEPTEAINQQHLGSITNDKDVQETFDRHLIKAEEESMDLDLDDEEDEDEDDEDEDFSNRKSDKKKSAVLHGGIRKKGFTWSQGGVKLAGKGRKNRKNYPPSWGMSPDRVTMKKRVLLCYDGERRLVKDDMMLNRDYEVRLPLPDGESYVTDLDVETMKRAEGFHGATDDERGPWILDESAQDLDLGELMA